MKKNKLSVYFLGFFACFITSAAANAQVIGGGLFPPLANNIIVSLNNTGPIHSAASSGGSIFSFSPDGGIYMNSSVPSNNKAKITINGPKNTVNLSQTTNATSDNNVNIKVDNMIPSSTGALIPATAGNTTDINLVGVSNTVNTNQHGGGGNNIKISVNGSTDQITSIQNGNRNSLQLKQIGDGAVVSTNQSGNNNKMNIVLHETTSLSASQTGDFNNISTNFWGRNNQLTVDQSGNRNGVVLLSDSALRSLLPFGRPSSASTNNVIDIKQQGNGNRVLFNTSGNNVQATLAQNGQNNNIIINNKATNTFNVSQTGNNLFFALTVPSARTRPITVTQSR